MKISPGLARLIKSEIGRRIFFEKHVKASHLYDQVGALHGLFILRQGKGIYRIEVMKNKITNFTLVQTLQSPAQIHLSWHFSPFFDGEKFPDLVFYFLVGLFSEEQRKELNIS